MDEKLGVSSACPYLIKRLIKDFFYYFLEYGTIIYSIETAEKEE
jgi:hypothetical protein